MLYFFVSQVGLVIRFLLMIGFFLSVCLEKNFRRKQVLKSEYLKIVYFIVRPNAILRYLAVLYHLNQDIKDARNREKTEVCILWYCCVVNICMLW